MDANANLVALDWLREVCAWIRGCIYASLIIIGGVVCAAAINGQVSAIASAWVVYSVAPLSVAWIFLITHGAVFFLPREMALDVERSNPHPSRTLGARMGSPVVGLLAHLSLLTLWMLLAPTESSRVLIACLACLAESIGWFARWATQRFDGAVPIRSLANSVAAEQDSISTEQFESVTNRTVEQDVTIESLSDSESIAEPELTDESPLDSSKTSELEQQLLKQVESLQIRAELGDAKSASDGTGGDLLRHQEFIGKNGELSSVSGWVNEPFLPGQRTLISHLVFLPRFRERPSLSIEVTQAPDTSARVTQCERFGARVELRLAKPAESSGSVAYHYHATIEDHFPETEHDAQRHVS